VVWSTNAVVGCSCCCRMVVWSHSREGIICILLYLMYSFYRRICCDKSRSEASFRALSTLFTTESTESLCNNYRVSISHDYVSNVVSTNHTVSSNQSFESSRSSIKHHQQCHKDQSTSDETKVKSQHNSEKRMIIHSISHPPNRDGPVYVTVTR